MFPLCVRFLFNKVNPWTHHRCLMACTNMFDALLICVRHESKKRLMKSLQAVISSLCWLTQVQIKFWQRGTWRRRPVTPGVVTTYSNYRKRFIWNQESRFSWFFSTKLIVNARSSAANNAMGLKRIFFVNFSIYSKGTVLGKAFKQNVCVHKVFAHLNHIVHQFYWLIPNFFHSFH